MWPRCQQVRHTDINTDWACAPAQVRLPPKKLLVSLPHPLNKNFHAFQKPVQELLDSSSRSHGLDGPSERGGAST